MRRLIFIPILVVILSCSEKVALTSDDEKYIELSIALGKVRIAARDSLMLSSGLDSVYSAYGTTKDKYILSSTAYSADAERAALVFRAINDSLKMR